MVWRGRSGVAWEERGGGSWGGACEGRGGGVWRVFSVEDRSLSSESERRRVVGWLDEAGSGVVDTQNVLKPIDFPLTTSAHNAQCNVQ